jgi:hypothetical protein
MLLIKRFPPGYKTPPPAGFFRCLARGCAVRLQRAGVCVCHDDPTPGDLSVDVPARALFPWR